MVKLKMNWIVKVVAYGVPALLIFLGYFAFMFGSISGLSVNPDVPSFGQIMIFSGIGVYVFELLPVKRLHRHRR